MFNPASPMELVQCPIGQQMVRPSQIASAFDIEPAVLNYLQEKEEESLDNIQAKVGKPKRELLS